MSFFWILRAFFPEAYCRLVKYLRHCFLKMHAAVHSPNKYQRLYVSTAPLMSLFFLSVTRKSYFVILWSWSANVGTSFTPLELLQQQLVLPQQVQQRHPDMHPFQHLSPPQ